MSYRIFDLKYVPENEEAQLKAYLHTQKVKFYETPKGRHSNPGIWVRKKEEAIRAREAINQFQEQWAKKAKGSNAVITKPTSRKHKILIFLVAVVLTIILSSPYM